MDDLDDLLDSIEVDHSLGDVKGSIKDGFKKNLGDLPEDLQDKWAGYLADDADVTVSKFKRSYEYRNWDDIKKAEDVAPTHKHLQGLIRNACVKSNFNEDMTVKVMDMINPDTPTGKVLQEAYYKQVLGDMKKAVLEDADFDSAAFPALAKRYGL